MKVLRKLGFELVPIKLPDDLPVSAITLMLGIEVAAVFDEITRTHRHGGVERLARHVPYCPVRPGRRVPAGQQVVRTKLMRAMAELMASVDVYVGSGLDLSITNLTGHPTAVFPMGFHDKRTVGPGPVR